MYEYSLYVLEVSSLWLFQVQHTWYLVRYMQAPNRLYKSEVRGSVSRVQTPLSRDYLIARTCCKQSNAFLMRRRRRSAVSPWNVDPLRSTTLRAIRSARSGLGQRSFRSSALHRKSCRASVSVCWRSAVAAVAQMDRYEPYLARCGTR